MKSKHSNMTQATSHNKREREDEPQDVKRRVSKSRTTKNKNIIFNFDGTGADQFDDLTPPNQPDYDSSGVLSNVAKLHLLFGGDFREETTKECFYDNIENQQSLYYSGVGTYGTPFRRLLNSAFAVQDVNEIIDKAIKDLRELYVHGDKVYVTGFSRGAAIARKFCGAVSKQDDLQSVKVELLVCFDTVASIGLPDFSTSNRPGSDVIFEDGHQIAPNIKQAIHCVSIDDKRRHFQPTLMNDEERVTEVWFAGNHGDIGGGWLLDGLSDVVLKYILNEIKERNVSLQVLSPIEIKFDIVSKASKGVDIDLPDVIIEANSLGTTHEQRNSGSPLYYHRELVVIRENVPVTDKLPIVHYSVKKRIDGLNYRPATLRKREHILLDKDNDAPNKTMTGLSEYLEIGARTLETLDVGQSRKVRIHADLVFNHTGLFLEDGHEYSFASNTEQQWKDGGIVCNADGREKRDGIRFFFAPSKRFRTANWFCLIGAVVDDNEKSLEMFEIGGSKKIVHTPKKSGEFCPFANDAIRSYNNNNGFVEVVVTRLD